MPPMYAVHLNKPPTLHTTGTRLGAMPPLSSILSTIRTIPNLEPLPTTQILSSFNNLVDPTNTPQQTPICYGIPSIPTKIQDKILVGDYIEFSELPPAKGKSLPPSALSSLKGSVLLINSADLYQQRKVIPDLGVWVQCYAIYMGVICSKHPDRLPDLHCTRLLMSNLLRL